MKLVTRVCLYGLTCLAVVAVAMPLAAAAQGQAGGVALILPSPISVRTAVADMVVTGKVAKLADKISAPAYPGAKDKVEYQIAVVRIDDPLLSAKGAKEVRVGFPVPQANGPRGNRAAALAEDEEVILFLRKHSDADFYVMPTNFDAIKKAKNMDYEKELEETKKAAKLLADPMTSLKAKEASDRYLTAAMLIERYRTPRVAATPLEQTPIDAAESKLILEALHDADWTPPQPADKVQPGQPTPFSTFLRLGLSKDDNWAPPAKKSFDESAKAWLKENAGVYRIKRFVFETNDAKKDK